MENRRSRRRPAPPVKDGHMNRRADQGLNTVADLFAGALGERCGGVERALLHKTVSLRQLRYVKTLELRYALENRFWERSYNLEISSEIDTDGRFEEVGDCLFQVEAKGRIRVRDVAWRYAGGGLDEEQIRAYTERLNNPLILERIERLDLSCVFAEHRRDSGKWIIQVNSILGSTTWVLLPPVMQTIKPKPEEFIRLAEFFDLTADAVVNNRI